MLRQSSAGVPRRKTTWVLGITLVLVSWSSTLWALEYDYDAPDVCPDREAFLSEVRGRLRYPAEQSTVERLEVSVRRKQGFEASFVLIEPGQPPVSRTLTAEACDEAVRALALGAALALDARYREVQGLPEEPPAPAPVPVPPAEATGSSAPAVAAVPVVPAPVAEPDPGVVQGEPIAPVPPPPPPRAPPAVAPAAVAAVGVDVPPPSEPAEASEPSALQVAMRLGAFGATGYAPDPSFGPSLAAVLRGNRFAFELEGFISSENRAGNGEQSAEFWVVGARLTPCLRWPLPDRFFVKGCGLVEFSGVHAEGVESSDVVRTEEDLVPYWALGVVAGGEAPLTEALNLGLDLGLQFPLSRQRFYFSNANEDLHEFPGVAFRAQLTICYAF